MVTVAMITEFKVHRQKRIANGIIYIVDGFYISFMASTTGWYSKPLLFISDECLALNYMVFLYSTLFSLHFSPR